MAETTLVPGPGYAAASAPRLPADLAKLRDRFLMDYPGCAERLVALAQVPAALRHLLGLDLELDRLDLVPQRYRGLVRATIAGGGTPADLDEVDRLVIAYAQALHAGRLSEAAEQLRGLRRFFVEPQLIELALVGALGQAMARFEVLVGCARPAALPPDPAGNQGTPDPVTTV